MADYHSLKRALLGALDGVILEIGGGRGANFALLPAHIRWLGLEPDSVKCRHLVAAAARRGHHSAVLRGVAERIPLHDHSVDAVIATVVLCSVHDQDRTLAEIRRVLRPGGSFVFFEHVGAPAGSWTRRAQRRWAPLSRRFDGGCDPSRDTWLAIQRAGFAEVGLQWFARRTLFDLINPYIAGRAVSHSEGHLRRS